MKTKRNKEELYPTTVELSSALRSALEECMERERRSKRATITIALEEYLAARGLWTAPAE